MGKLLARLRRARWLASVLLPMVWRALGCFWAEMRYYLPAKKAILTRGRGGGDNPGMVLRKRAHNLERFVFDPGAYAPAYGAEAAADLRALLERHPELPRRQRAWAERVLADYQRPEQGGTRCRMLIEGAPRPSSPLAPDEFMRLLRARRSRRFFSGEPLTPEHRRQLTEAAQLAPSSCNRQSLELIFVEEADLRGLVASSVPGGRQFFERAPCILVLVSDGRDYRYPDDRMTPFIDGAAAMENLYLMCEVLGLGCCWGSYTSLGNIAGEKAVRRRLGIPESHLIVGALAVGPSDQFVCEIPRDPVELRMGLNRFRGKP